MYKLTVPLAFSMLFFTYAQESKQEGDNVTNKTLAEISVAQDGRWIDGPRGHKEYTDARGFKNVDQLVVPKEHTDHSWFVRYEGPGWENAQVGYRIYLDWRNAIDIFGKKVDTMVLPYVGQDGFDSYHEASDWGQDILKAGKSMGIGGYGRLESDKVIHFQHVGGTVAKVQNDVTESVVHIDYQNWQAGSEILDLTAKLSIGPEDRDTKVVLIPSREVTGICTGIVKHNVPFFKREGKNWGYIATYGKQTLTTPVDNLGMALFYRLDEVSEQKEGTDDHLVVFKPTTKSITYYFLGAWEQELHGIKSEEAFLSDVDRKLTVLEAKNAIR
ncbi:MAG: hypothetical protein RLZZ241_142 [Bacteroidota bacterium]|jgi:hypothetical protein